MISRLIAIAVVCAASLLHGQDSNMVLLDPEFTLPEPLHFKLLDAQPNTIVDKSKNKEELKYRSITLARTNSLLFFGGYEVTFDQNGEVRYRGGSRAAKPGSHSARIEKTTYKKLCYTVGRLDLDNPNRPTNTTVWDRPWNVIRVTLRDGSTVTLCDRGDDEEEGQDFQLITAYLERLVGYIKWKAD